MKYILLIFVVVQYTFAQGNVLQTTSSTFENNRIPDSMPVFSHPVEQQINPGEQKSVALAALYSFLLPGMGELYVGSYSSGKYFTVAEGLLWVTLIGFDRYGTLVQNDARNYAVQHAGITVGGKEDQYFVNIGDYENIREYNDDMLRLRAPHKLYNEQSSYVWEWDSKMNREYFRDLRVSSDQAFNNVSFVAAAIGINHLVSAINAAMSAKSYNQNLEQTGFLGVRARVLGGMTNPHGIMISFSTIF